MNILKKNLDSQFKGEGEAVNVLNNSSFIKSKRLVRNLFMATSIFSGSLLINGCSSDSDKKGDLVTVDNVNKGDGEKEVEVEKYSKVGILEDAIIEGAGYRNICYNENNDTVAGLSGMTNEFGEFEIQEGCTVEFFVGGVKIGDLDYSELNSDQIATLQDIVGVDRSNTSDDKVVEIGRFFQSLDSTEDGKILITEDVLEKLKDYTFNFDTVLVDDAGVFDNSATSKVDDLIEAAGKTSIDRDIAIGHLDIGLEEMGITPNKKPVISGTFPSEVLAGSPYFAEFNAVDIDGEITSVEIDGLPEWATFDSDTYQISGIPNEENAGIYSLRLRVKDNNGLERIFNFDINVKLNTAPTVTVNTTVTLDEDGTSATTFTVEDADGDTVTPSIETDATSGTVTIDGTNINYVPTSNYNGTDTFTISYTDGNGTTVEKTFNVTVNSVNDTPVVSSFTIETVGQSVSQNLSSYISDIDTSDGELTILSVSEPSNGLITWTGKTFEYTANDGFEGNDSFTYKVFDGENYSEVETVILNGIDKKSPNLPSLTEVISSTYEDSVSVEVNGEPGSEVWVNDIWQADLDSNGKADVNISTAGDDGTKDYSIYLIDNNGNQSESLSGSIEKMTEVDINSWSIEGTPGYVEGDEGRFRVVFNAKPGTRVLFTRAGDIPIIVGDDGVYNYELLDEWYSHAGTDAYSITFNDLETGEVSEKVWIYTKYEEVDGEIKAVKFGIWDYEALERTVYIID